MMLRSFIAVEIPVSIQSAIGHATAGLRQALQQPLVRWVDSRNLHLTLKFLGNVSPTNLERLAEALKVEVAGHQPFKLSLGGLGAFPTPSRARVIWIGLDAPADLSTLQRGVEAVAARMGYPLEERPFSPHLTVGRVRQNVSTAELQRIRAALETTTVGALGTVQVDAIHIYKSDLQPGGAVYTHLYSLPMIST